MSITTQNAYVNEPNMTTVIDRIAWSIFRQVINRLNFQTM